MDEMFKGITDTEFTKAYEDIRILRPPIYVGGYRIEDLTYSLRNKPKWFNRVMVKLFFGIEWVDYKLE